MIFAAWKQFKELLFNMKKKQTKKKQKTRLQPESNLIALGFFLAKKAIA